MEAATADLKKKIQERREENGMVRTLPIDKVRPWPNQPRKFFSKKSIRDLGESINQVGQKVPILVIQDPDDPEFYSIDDGERRWRACRLIGRRSIQGIVLPKEGDDDRLVRSIVANFGREGHAPYELALVLKRLYGMKRYTTHQIAAMFAKSDCWVYQHLSLNKLDQRVIAMMSRDIPFESRLKFAIAILLTTLPEDIQYEIAKGVVDNKMRLKAARHYVEVKAAEKGFKVGGIAGRPERRRRSLTSLLAALAESLPTFLNAPDITLYDFLISFPRVDFAEVVKWSEECQKGLSALCAVISEAKIEFAKPVDPPVLKKKKKKKGKS